MLEHRFANPWVGLGWVQHFYINYTKHMIVQYSSAQPTHTSQWHSCTHLVCLMDFVLIYKGMHITF